jgi:hypothetical protein
MKKIEREERNGRRIDTYAGFCHSSLVLHYLRSLDAVLNGIIHKITGCGCWKEAPPVDCIVRKFKHELLLQYA